MFNIERVEKVIQQLTESVEALNALIESNSALLSSINQNLEKLEAIARRGNG